MVIISLNDYSGVRAALSSRRRHHKIAQQQSVKSKIDSRWKFPAVNCSVSLFHHRRILWQWFESTFSVSSWNKRSPTRRSIFTHISHIHDPTANNLRVAALKNFTAHLRETKIESENRLRFGDERAEEKSINCRLNGSADSHIRQAPDKKEAREIKWIEWQINYVIPVLLRCLDLLFSAALWWLKHLVQAAN